MSASKVGFAPPPDDATSVIKRLPSMTARAAEGRLYVVLRVLRRGQSVACDQSLAGAPTELMRSESLGALFEQGRLVAEARRRDEEARRREAQAERARYGAD